MRASVRAVGEGGDKQRAEAGARPGVVSLSLAEPAAATVTHGQGRAEGGDKQRADGGDKQRTEGSAGDAVAKVRPNPNPHPNPNPNPTPSPNPSPASPVADELLDELGAGEG